MDPISATNKVHERAFSAPDIARYRNIFWCSHTRWLLSRNMGINGSNRSIFSFCTVDLGGILQTYSSSGDQDSLTPLGE